MEGLIPPVVLAHIIRNDLYIDGHNRPRNESITSATGEAAEMDQVEDEEDGEVDVMDNDCDPL